MTNITRNYIVSKRIKATPANFFDAVLDLHAKTELVNLTYREYDGALYTHVCRVVEVCDRVLIIERLPHAYEVETGAQAGKLIDTIVKMDAIVKLEKRQYVNDSVYDKYYTALWDEMDDNEGLNRFTEDL
ncbi:hypothetical protein [Bacillus phage Megatron]|uniref:Uncharacterized protein n=1 Tax=Bacillus phage Megatron TaxID=1486661 RepID=A0A024B340_9CAUD|nr:hypothetical protein FP75_gp278 [Bacillus phage Megatron]AHZ10860.1 hypothetical protein [Bacillus phage Megatron]